MIDDLVRAATRDPAYDNGPFADGPPPGFPRPTGDGWDWVPNGDGIGGGSMFAPNGDEWRPHPCLPDDIHGRRKDQVEGPHWDKRKAGSKKWQHKDLGDIVEEAMQAGATVAVIGGKVIVIDVGVGGALVVGVVVGGFIGVGG